MCFPNKVRMFFFVFCCVCFFVPAHEHTHNNIFSYCSYCLLMHCKLPENVMAIISYIYIFYINVNAIISGLNWLVFARSLS